MSFAAPWGLGFFVAGILVVLAFQAGGVDRAADVSGFKGDAALVLLVAFFLASAIERLVELLNRIEFRLPGTARAMRPFGDVHMIKGLVVPHAHDPAVDPVRVAEEQRKRIVSSWGLASLLGMLLSYFTVGLFELLGVVVSVPGVLESHSLDAIVTGMVIGSGTKPFHDLIVALEKRRERPREENEGHDH